MPRNQSFVVIACLLIFLVVLPDQVLAQNCTAVPDDTQRLACYDAAAAASEASRVARVSEAAAAVRLDVPVVAKWRVRKEKSAMIDTTDIFMEVSSEGSHVCRAYGNAPSKIYFMARCMENTTSVIVYGDCHVASGFQGYGEVTYRIDDEEARDEAFEASTDNSALGLWSGGRAIPFLKDLLDKDQIIVRFTPFNMSPVEATFNIRGIADAIKPLREACSW
jgi:type VI secretion system protein VasI